MNIDPAEFGALRSDVKHAIELLEKQNGRIAKVENQVGRIRWVMAWIAGAATTIGTGIGTQLSKFIPW